MNIKDEVYIKNEICFTRIGPLPVPCVNVKVIYNMILFTLYHQVL